MIELKLSCGRFILFTCLYIFFFDNLFHSNIDWSEITVVELMSDRVVNLKIATCAAEALTYLIQHVTPQKEWDENMLTKASSVRRFGTTMDAYAYRSNVVKNQLKLLKAEWESVAVNGIA